MVHSAGKHAVIVGVGPGLGSSLARTLAAEGYDLSLIARTPASLAPIVGELRAAGVQVNPLHVDISDLNALADAIERARIWRPVTLVHHNASTNPGALLETDIGQLTASVNVNALAAVVSLRHALPDLEANGGRVTWTGGGAALNPREPYGVLSVGKAALRAAALALAPELKERGVALRMLTVVGLIRPGTALDPERIAAAMWSFATEDTSDVERQFTGR